MKIKPDNQKEYLQTKQQMLFACIWKERPQGGFNLFDYKPFAALRKVENQGVTAYVGKDIEVKKHNETNTWLIIIEAGEVYMPVSFFNKDGDDRIFVSNDLDEICQMYIERRNKKI